MIVAGKRELEGDAESLDRHDGDGANRRADGQIDEGILLSIARSDSVNHEDGECHDCDGVEQEA